MQSPETRKRSRRHMRQLQAENIVGILLTCQEYKRHFMQWLYKNIVHNPHSASGMLDINLIKQVECFLSSMVTATPNEGMHRVIKHCTENRCLAESAVSRVKALSV